MVVLEHLQLELGVRRQLADDVVQAPRRRRDGPRALLAGRRNLRQEGGVQIRGGQRQRAVARLQKHVREDLMRGSLLDDALDQSELAGENRGGKCQLHDDSLTNLNRIIQNPPKEVEVVGGDKKCILVQLIDSRLFIC